VGLLTIGCQRAPEEPQIQARTLAQTTPVAVLSFEMFQAALDAPAVLGASESLLIGDRVQVLQDGAPAAIANAGPGLTWVGSDARIGSLWSAGPVDLRDRASVNGIVYASTVTMGNGVSPTGGVVSQLPTAMVELYEESGEAEGPLENIMLEPDQFLALDPGDYGQLTVKSRARLRISGDAEYSFTRVHFETDSKVETSSQCESTEMRVSEALFFRGKVVEPNGPATGLMIHYDGTQTAHVEASYRGIILAPRAELIINSSSHKGAFYAKRLRVQADARIEAITIPGGIADSCEPPPLPAWEALPTPAPIGPAPTLEDGGDVDDFLTWFVKIRKGEIDEARAAAATASDPEGIVQVAVQRFEQSRDSDFMRAQMILSFTSSLNTPGVDLALTSLLQQSVPADPATEFGDASDEYNREFSYRVSAMNALASRASPSGLQAIRNVALTHLDRNLRGHAISTLAYRMTPSELEALRDVILPEDEIFLDRPNRSQPGFADKMSAFRAKYGAE